MHLAPKEMASRSPEALRHHFEVERELAARLRSSRREDRAELVPRLYAELYARVPDHPRRSGSCGVARDERMFRSRTNLLRPFLSPGVDFVEFGAGDGEFCRVMSSSVRSVTALEVCEQTDTSPADGGDVRWVYYDGLQIPLPDASFDVAFSYQVLEHIHPDDVEIHMREAARMLRPGGVYVLSTPHALSGPHDISRFFTDHLETFHLKEWTYGELSAAFRRAGFNKIDAYVRGWPRPGVGMLGWRACEVVLGLAPPKIGRGLARRILNNVVVAAVRSDSPGSSALKTGSSN